MLWSMIAILALASGALAREQFIVGGGDVNISDYPWQGSLRTSSNSHSCGCISIGGVYVLTAGHCAGSTSHTMQFGSTNISADGPTIFNIESVLLHPNYTEGPGFYPNDISIITATTVVTGVNISPATMHIDNSNPGGTGMITGWGRTVGGAPIPTTLQGTSIGIITDAECAEVWQGYFQSDSMICVWDGVDGAVGACNGDSGGPMTIGNTLYGITSWFYEDCLSSVPSVYVRVGVFHQWVCNNTGNTPTGC